jgi:hypothetical protein
MMKNTYSLPIRLLSAGLLAAALYSCNKLTDSFQKESSATKYAFQQVTGGTDSVNIYNCVWLVGDQIVSAAADSAQHIAVTAAFTDSGINRVVGVRGFSINGMSLGYNARDSTFYFDYSDSVAYLQEGLDLYGTDVQMKITGSGPGDTVTQAVYMPKMVNSGGGSFPVGQINIANNLPLSWTPDAGNASGNVYIKIWYNAKMSRILNDSTLPATDTVLTYTVPDNGAYTIDSSDLMKLRPNSYVTMSLGRGSQATAVLPVSGRKVFYYATSSESSGPITLIYAPR